MPTSVTSIVIVATDTTAMTTSTTSTTCTQFPYRVAVVAEQLLRLLHACGMPLTDVDFLCGRGPAMNHVMNEAQPRSTLFTGSKRVAEKLAVDMHGKVCLNRNTKWWSSVYV